jgi:hypothetical protein
MAISKFEFTKAITNTSPLNNCLKPELFALKNNANKIKIETKCKCTGSVDIDNCLQESLPNDSRWDYIFGIYFERGKETFYYVEIHRGEIDQVDKVINKFNWLLAWIYKHSPESLALYLDESEYYWITTGGNHIPSNTIEARQLAQSGLILTSLLTI